MSNFSDEYGMFTELLWIINKIRNVKAFFKLHQFSSVTQSCPTLCDPMNHRTSGLPVHHQIPEFTQTHVRWVGDVIQPSHPLSSPSPPTFNYTSNHLYEYFLLITFPGWESEILITELNNMSIFLELDTFCKLFREIVSLSTLVGIVE